MPQSPARFTKPACGVTFHFLITDLARYLSRLLEAVDCLAERTYNLANVSDSVGVKHPQALVR